MDEKEFKEARRQIMQATFELESKALNYLLVANGAGFAGCVATLKDYASVPQLHGVGILIAIFGTGLVSATIAFLLFQSGHFEVMRRVLVEDENPERAVFYMGFTSAFTKLSGALFIVAVVIIAFELAKL